MSKSIFIRGWTVVAMLLAVAVCEPLSAQPAPVQTAADEGIIAYVQYSTDDIHVISPDGTGDRLLWTNPGQGGMKSVMYLALAA